MEIGTINEFSRIAEDILNYFRSTFAFDASTTVYCVEQLLKCLFGTNLTVNLSELAIKNQPTRTKVTTLLILVTYLIVLNVFRIWKMITVFIIIFSKNRTT